SNRYRPVPVTRPNRPIVVNDVASVSVWLPSVDVAVTDAVYVELNSSGAAGTQEVPSSRISPEIFFVDPFFVSVTSVTRPPVSAMPTSAEIGRSSAPSSGVTAKVNGSGGGVGEVAADGSAGGTHVGSGV